MSLDRLSSSVPNIELDVYKTKLSMNGNSKKDFDDLNLKNVV